MLDSARGEISFRRYNEALELLKQVEEVDPTNPELPLLMGDANSGLEQVKRKEAVTKLEEEVAQAVSYEQLQEVAKSVQAAMAAMPTEAALYRLNTQVERQIKEHENRFLVDETVQACRNLRPREALELVRKARLRLPGEERLLSLEALLANRVQQQSVEERRADYLARAREALESKPVLRCGPDSGDVPDRGHRHRRNPLPAGFCPRRGVGVSQPGAAPRQTRPGPVADRRRGL